MKFSVPYTPPGILLDSNQTPRTPIRLQSHSLYSPKTEAISTKKQKKITQDPELFFVLFLESTFYIVTLNNTCTTTIKSNYEEGGGG
jgi:hypothetical protein